MNQAVKRLDDIVKSGQPDSFHFTDQSDDGDDEQGDFIIDGTDMTVNDFKIEIGQRGLSGTVHDDEQIIYVE